MVRIKNKNAGELLCIVYEYENHKYIVCGVGRLHFVCVKVFENGYDEDIGCAVGENHCAFIVKAL